MNKTIKYLSLIALGAGMAFTGCANADVIVPNFQKGDSLNYLVDTSISMNAGEESIDMKIAMESNIFVEDRTDSGWVIRLNTVVKDYDTTSPLALTQLKPMIEQFSQSPTIVLALDKTGQPERLVNYDEVRNAYEQMFSSYAAGAESGIDADQEDLEEVESEETEPVEIPVESSSDNQEEQSGDSDDQHEVVIEVSQAELESILNEDESAEPECPDDTIIKGVLDAILNPAHLANEYTGKAGYFLLFGYNTKDLAEGKANDFPLDEALGGTPDNNKFKWDVTENGKDLTVKATSDGKAMDYDQTWKLRDGIPVYVNRTIDQKTSVMFVSSSKVTYTVRLQNP